MNNNPSIRSENLHSTSARQPASRGEIAGLPRPGTFGSGSLIDALRNQVTALDRLRSTSVEEGGQGTSDVSDAPDSDSGSITMAQVAHPFDPLGSPFGIPDHVESVKNPDVTVIDPMNAAGADGDPFDFSPIPAFGPNVFDGLAARDRLDGFGGPAVRTSTFGPLSISESRDFTSTTDSTTGETLTYGTNAAGERTTTVSTPQLSGAASPRTVVTFTEHADGSVTRQESETSPTGMTYETAPEPEPPPEPAPRPTPPRRSTFESDGSQSNGVGSDFSSSDGDPDAGYSSPF